MNPSIPAITSTNTTNNSTSTNTSPNTASPTSNSVGKVSKIISHGKRDANETIELVSNTRRLYKARTNTPLEGMSLCLSYCKHTNTKIAVGTSFSNSPTANKCGIIASEHPIFGLALPKISAIYHESHTPTEKYIAMTAYLLKLGVILTRDAALQLSVPEYEKVEPVFQQLLLLTVTIIHDSNKVATLMLPTLCITDENCSRGDWLKSHIKYCIDIMEASEANYFATRIKREATRAGLEDDYIQDLYDAADDERSLLLLLSNRKSAALAYNKKLGAWAVKRIKSNTDYDKLTIAFIEYHIFTSSDRLTSDNIRKAIGLVKEGLTYEDYERESSLLVVRMLESKLEEVELTNADYGFSEMELLITTVKKAGVSYKIKQQTAESIASQYQIVTRRPAGESALERLRNKFAAPATPTASSKE